MSRPTSHRAPAVGIDFVCRLHPKRRLLRALAATDVPAFDPAEMWLQVGAAGGKGVQSRNSGDGSWKYTLSCGRDCTNTPQIRTEKVAVMLAAIWAPGSTRTVVFPL